VEGFDERLSKGVMPVPLMFFSTPGSAYWGFRAPTADWLVEASDKMVDSIMKHTPKFIQAATSDKGGGMPRVSRSGQSSSYLTIVYDELQRRIQEIGSILSKQKE